MRRTVRTVALTVSASFVVIGGVFVAVTTGVASLSDAVRGYMGVSRAFELQAAAAEGDLAAARAILESEPDLANSRDGDGWTPLHEAARGGHAAVVSLLITSGADVGSRDCQGATPLHAAARAGEARVARVLVACGARLDAKDNLGRSAACYADRAGSTACLDVLRDLGGTPPSAKPSL